MRPSQGDIGAQWPCPNTRQYLHHGALRNESRRGRAPRREVDISGFVMAGPTLDASEEHNREDEERMNMRLNEFRLVYQCISAWTVMLWQSQEDFEAGVHGGYHVPRPITWFDLRRAYDVHLERGDSYAHLMPNRITLQTHTGSYYFCVEHPDDAALWFEALWRTVQDAQWQRVLARDNVAHQRKRWPAACGVANALFMQRVPVGPRAMAILFHAYNVDCDCKLSAGELMLLLQELVAALVHDEGHAEGGDRNAAVASAQSRVHEDELFDRAMQVRKRITPSGEVRKDEFILCGAAALAEAIYDTGLVADLGGDHLVDAGNLGWSFSLL